MYFLPFTASYTFPTSALVNGNFPSSTFPTTLSISVSIPALLNPPTAAAFPPSGLFPKIDSTCFTTSFPVTLTLSICLSPSLVKILERLTVSWLTSFKKLSPISKSVPSPARVLITVTLISLFTVKILFPLIKIISIPSSPNLAKALVGICTLLDEVTLAFDVVTATPSLLIKFTFIDTPEKSISVSLKSICK